MKVIFLEFEGVLNGSEYLLKNGQPTYITDRDSMKLLLDPKRMEFLRQVVDFTGASLVLSAFWKRHWSSVTEECDEIGQRINQIFAEYQLELYDKTPELGGEKATEIATWLASRDDVENYVVLMDNFYFCEAFAGHFAGGDRKEGMTKATVADAIDVLSKSERLSMTAEEFRTKFLSEIQLQKQEHEVHMTISGFFAGEQDLHLTFLHTDKGYLVHDNGCAVNILKTHLGGLTYENAAQAICPPHMFCGERVQMLVGDWYVFVWYLHTLVVVANADLCGVHMMQYFSDREPVGEYQVLEISEDDLKAHLDAKIYIGGEKNNITVGFGTSYAYSMVNTPYKHLMEALADGTVRFRDPRRWLWEGGMLENFQWNHDKVEPYREYLKPYLDRFGAELTGEEFLIRVPSDADLYKTLYRYMNLAVMIGAMGLFIDVP